MFNMPWHVQLFVGIVSTLLLTACGNVQVKPNDPMGVATLKPTQEDKHAGLVGVASGFTPKAYRTIIVEAFRVTDKALSGEDDKEFAQMMPAYLQAHFILNLRAAALFENVRTPTDAAPLSENGKTLKLQGQISQLSGGSRGLRFWIGFGAGRSKVQIETRLVDAESGRVLVVTADRRIGVMSEAMSLDYGGSSRGLLDEAVDEMSRDYVRFLANLRGGSQ